MASKKQSLSVVLLTVLYETVLFWAVRIRSKRAIYMHRKVGVAKIAAHFAHHFLPYQLLIPAAAYGKKVTAARAKKAGHNLTHTHTSLTWQLPYLHYSPVVARVASKWSKHWQMHPVSRGICLLNVVLPPQVSSEGIVVVQCVCVWVCQKFGNYFVLITKWLPFFSNNSNCNAILRLEGNINGNWYRE